MFNSFFLAGFECATGYNVQRQWMDQLAATQHDRFGFEDYRLLRRAGIRAAREGIRWPLVDRNGGYDFSTVRPFINASRAHEVEVIWDLFHYGYPGDVDLFSERFPERFADYCYAIARYIGNRTEGVCYFTPVNEPSYFAWAGGQVGVFSPHERHRGPELKRCLARAAIRGIEAIWAACPHARIVNADPLCRVVPPEEHPELLPAAEGFNQGAVFESWDMLCGRLHPELGGSRSHLDIVGINYYWTNQWELTREGIPLPDDDPRRAPFRELVRSVWDRYGGDVMVTETSHVDEKRPLWLRELTGECEALLEEGVPLQGVCLYPILGMPEWHAPEVWTRMGLWDLVDEEGRLCRVPYAPMHGALREASRRLERRRARTQRSEVLARAA